MTTIAIIINVVIANITINIIVRTIPLIHDTIITNTTTNNNINIKVFKNCKFCCSSSFPLFLIPMVYAGIPILRSLQDAA